LRPNGLDLQKYNLKRDGGGLYIVRIFTLFTVGPFPTLHLLGTMDFNFWCLLVSRRRTAVHGTVVVDSKADCSVASLSGDSLPKLPTLCLFTLISIVRS
jgi:hypothetical protein